MNTRPKDLALTIIITLLISLYCECEGVSQPAQEEARKAAASFASGRFDEAIDGYTKAIALDPQNADLHFSRAWSYHKRGDKGRGDYNNAARGYTEALRIKPEYAPKMIYALRSDAYAEAGNAEAAIADYTKAIEMDPATANYYSDRGNAYFKTGRYDKAKADYTKAIELDPNGRAGKVAGDNLRILTEALKEKAAMPATLTPDEMTWLNSMEQEWGRDIDGAVPFMRGKDYSRAIVYIKKATGAIAAMKGLLFEKGYKLDAIDRLVGMERLTEAYANMAKIAAYAGDARAAVQDLRKVQALFADTREKLIEAQAKFHEVPPLQELCRQFIGILDEFEREVRRLVS